jgi:hypothetical protein
LREDLPVPIQHPTLTSLELPGEARMQVRLKSWQDHQQLVTLAVAGNDLVLTPTKSQFVLPAKGEHTLEIHAAPTKGAGMYECTITMHSGAYSANEQVIVAAWHKGGAIAYELDYDRDGFPDVILENSKVRLFVSPYAGGRAFAFVNKATGANAFNSVGGMRDSFTKRVVPEDMRDLPEWTTVGWLGLYNRTYKFHIISKTGGSAIVQLQYSAPDIYPGGIEIDRSLTLFGDSNYFLEDTALRPAGSAGPQSYVLENSVTFRLFSGLANFRQWFAEEQTPKDFVPEKSINLPAASTTLGTINPKTGETFAILLLSTIARNQLVVHGHAATIRTIYPRFAEKNKVYKYRTAYFFGRASRQEIHLLYASLKNTSRSGSRIH